MPSRTRLAAAAILSALGLGGCAEVARLDAAATAGGLDYAVLEARALRAFDEAYLERPFANGSMAVLATEGGEVSTFHLAPCRGGLAICAGGPHGPAGTLRVSPDWHVVEGLYGRTFWLSYAGDGWLERGGQVIPLAWEARREGPGPDGLGEGETGDDAALERPVPHG